MIQRREDFRLALKARESIVVSRERRRQDLDGDLALQFGICGPIHLPHSAFADLRGDVVDAETRAGGKSQAVKLYGRAGLADEMGPAKRRTGDLAWPGLGS
jgi:hypothetical protein